MEIRAFCYRLIHRLPRHIVSRRHTGLVHTVQVRRILSAFRIFYHRKPVLPADAIRCFPHLPVRLPAVMIFFPVPKGYGIEKQVVMDAVRIHVSRYDHLKASRPELFCKLHSYPVRFLRTDFSRCKALVSVIGYDATGL